MLEVKNLTKNYNYNNQVVKTINNLSFSVGEGKFIALVGPSGCGKSTLLKIVAGLLKPTSGEILLHNQKVQGPHKDRGMIFQQLSLFPWLTVKKNIAFGLSLHNLLSSKEKNEIVDHYLSITELGDFANSYPKHLSGGMQQRVAIARTLANDPKVLLMDEPFGSLDAQTRHKMQEFLVKIWESKQKTILFVTHDIEEAIFLADTIYIFSDRPAQIKKIFDISLLRPRVNDLKHSQEFFEIKKTIARELE